MSSDEFDFDDDASMASSEDDNEDDDSFFEENDHPNQTTKDAKNKKRSSNKSSSKKSKTTNDSEYDRNNKEPRGKKTVEQTYQKKTQLEHILLRPDTYIGSVEPLTQTMFILNTDSQGTSTPSPKIQQREITYTPGLYKIFDEILVNAADNKQRDSNMDRMEIVIDDGGMDGGDGVISVLNNGRGIPVVRHKEHDCYVPTLIFGHLLTGSNFDDKEEKTTGGRNGYGAKLANIFSTEFTVECLDSKEGLKFKQVWRKNMAKANDPTIKKCTEAEKKKGDYTKITFKPDLEKFNMTHLDDDTVGLLSKRAYDIAGCMGLAGGKKLNVFLNGSKIPVKDFKSYLALFEGISPPSAYEKIVATVDEKELVWEVGASVSDGSFNQISFANAIATTKGGGHVNYITDLICKNLQPAIKKKNKGGKEIKANQIKNHLSIFVNCLVQNPTFDSQTKENLTTRPASFKKHAVPSDKFFKQVEKCGVVDAVMSYAKFKQNQALKRKGGTKKSKLTGITKLDDANFAGTAKSKDCTLIITEGDSAKSLAVSGLSVVGRDYYGVFPLKGKPLNVRDATHAQIMKNEEIMNVVEIMGLKFGTEYTPENVKSLRYGHLMIMADQDQDGSHIKGLIINFIHHFWPTLLDIPDFLMQFITPIVKCTKGKKTHTFFTLPEYEEWKEETGNDAKGWTIKYYKGLGTSTSSEAKEYFSNLDIHEIHFNELSSDVIDVDDEDMEESSPDIITSGSGLIDMAFSKSKVEARKRWLNSIQLNTFLNYSKAQENGVNYSEFINRELILFSIADNVRSIPHVMDGFKPSQRKVLFACFKKKLKNEIKVAQLAGYIGEHSAYHHGDMSLNGTIIGMAQSYCGSNNINLLYPSGQFGTRRMGGKDHASARYIFTRLEKIARTIFHPDDDELLHYLNDDGISIEPDYYIPVIPMVLVNGSDGIGTGYSSTIHKHDPREVITNLRKMIRGEEPEIMHPHFAGFTGEIIAETGTRRAGSYIVRGKIERTNNTTLLISELPLGKWTQDFKAGILEAMMAGTDKKPSEISDFKENHTDTTVSFTVTASKENIDQFEKFKGGLYGKFKLSTTISTNNMTAFDVDGKLHKYATTNDILRVFFDQRLESYIKRKKLLVEKMRRELRVLDNKARFVEEVCSGDLVVSNRKRSELLADLQERHYDLFPKEDKKTEDEDDSEDEVEESASDADLAKGYEYLLGMKIWSLTFERAEELRRQLAEKTEEVSKLEATEPETIWLNDLERIEEVLDERDIELDADAKKEKNAQSKARVRVAKKASNAAKKTKKVAKKKDEWDSELERSDESDDDTVAFKPKPAPPKKALISIDNSESSSKNKKASSKKSSSKKSDGAPPKKKPTAKAAGLPKKKAFSEESDEEMDDFYDDNESVGSSLNVKAQVSNGNRSSRRSRAKVSYKIDELSDDEPEPDEESDEEMMDLEMKVEYDDEDEEIAKKGNFLEDEWDDFDEEVDKPLVKKTASKKKKASKPEPSRVFQTLSDEVDDSQSVASLSPIKKSSKSKKSKKVLPKKKTPPAAKSKLITKKPKTLVKKTICDLSSDEGDFIDDESMSSGAHSIERGGTHFVMNHAAPKASSGRRARGKASYSYADESSDDELDDDSEVEFD